MEGIFDTYFGGKGVSGAYQKIINHIRPHIRYIEPFLGNGTVFRKKKMAQINYLNDISPNVYRKWKTRIGNRDSIILSNFDALELLERSCPVEGSYYVPGRTVIYADPPYPLDSRKSTRDRYKFEMTDEQHRELLEFLRALDPGSFDVLVSTYKNPIYSEALKDWNLVKFRAITRGGVATEYLYMNFDNPEGVLHEYTYLGEDFRERERIKNKINRHVTRLKRLPALERNAIIEAIKGVPG